MKNNRIGVGTAIALSLICVSVGCSAAQDDAAFTQGTEEVTQQAIFYDEKSDLNVAVLTAPPELTAVCGNKSAEALRGTTSWHYQNEDGTGTGFCSDAVHPLEAKEHMTPLELTPAAVSSVNPLEAYLRWDTAPDKVSVRFWNEECWNNPTAESDEIPVNITDTDLNTPTFSIELKDGNCIYEVVAEWNSNEKHGGTAYYSFYTVKPDMELQPVN